MFKLLTYFSDFLGNRCGILILSPNFRSFGNSIDEIYFGLLHCIDKDKKLILVRPFDSFAGKRIKFANKHLYELEHELIHQPPKTINFIFSVLLTFQVINSYVFINLKKFIANILDLEESFYNSKELSSFATPQFGKRFLWSYSEDSHYTPDEWRMLESRYEGPKLAQSSQRLSEKFLKEHAPESLNRNLVALHVLDNTMQDFARGANIETYYPAIEFLTKKEFHIFRLGDSTMPKCKKITHLSDFAHIKHESFIDLYIFMNASFHLVVNSGPSYASNLFKIPEIMTNTTEWSTSVPRKEGSLFITKKFYRKSNDKLIYLSELLEEDFNFQVNTNSIEGRDLYLRDNSSEEILELIKEYLVSQDLPHTENQISFNLKRKLWLKKYLSQSNYKISYSPKNQYSMQRIRSLAMSSTFGTIADSFLEKFWQDAP